jgi:4-methyl-5(b-hydroxyethyl)-thiazole monophosphate biosynthesis
LAINASKIAEQAYYRGGYITMKNVYLFLADGFEEVEAITPIDILRRGGINVETVSVSGNKIVHGSHGINIEADLLFDKNAYDDAAMLILPGGGKGTQNLKDHKELNGILHKAYNSGKLLAAICAAPSVFGLAGFLDGKTAVCYPGFEVQLIGATIGKENVCTCENITTSKGAGTALEFSLKLLEILTDKSTADSVKASIMCNKL